MSRKNRLQRKLATRSSQWQQVRLENAALCHRLAHITRSLQEMQHLQQQASATAAGLTQTNRAYVEAFERMASMLGRECIAAGVPQNRVFPHYRIDCISTQYFLPEYLEYPFASVSTTIYQRTSMMLRILRAHPLVVDSLRKQIHFRASFGGHHAQWVYAISDAALIGMEAEMLTELISAELAGLLLEQLQQLQQASFARR